MMLDGETRVIAIIGDPIAQVKSPGGVTAALAARGRNAVVIPVRVSVPDVDTFVRGFSCARNGDGILVTVPHKFAAYRHCTTATPRAHLLGAVNVMRRNADGSWHGDQLDGAGFVDGVRAAGGEPSGRRALMAGAGGAGSAIALALLDAGVSVMAIHDDDPRRRDALVEKLRGAHGERAVVGSVDPTGFSLVVNATPAGMRAADPLPFDIGKLAADMFVGDVITRPAVTPLIAAARASGCMTQAGGGMFDAVSKLLVDFLLASPAHPGDGR